MDNGSVIIRGCYCDRCGHAHPTRSFVTWANGMCLFCPDQPVSKKKPSDKLWDVQVCSGKHLKQTLFYGLERALAENKKQQLIDDGITCERHIWIVRAGTEPKPPKRKV